MNPNYTTIPEIWELFCAKWPSGQERDLMDLYSLVEGRGLRPGDHDADAPGSTGLRWRRNVRNVLQARTTSGDLVRTGRGRYWMG